LHPDDILLTILMDILKFESCDNNMSDIVKYSEEQTTRVVEVLKGVAHPIRFRIVVLLCDEERTVTEMMEILGARQSLISQHLAILRLTGLVEVDNCSGRNRYRLREPMLRNLISCLSSCQAR
jgi:DNA-binding transcriptional ArsR family regulator